MKTKINIILLIIMTFVNINAYAADNNVFVYPSNADIYVTSQDETTKAEGLKVFLIGDYNFFKLRDVGSLMNFAIEWNPESREIFIAKGIKGSREVKGSGLSKPQRAIPVFQDIYVNDVSYKNLTAYNIDGYLYFKLRDMAEMLNFSCLWNSKTNSIMLDLSKDYTKDIVDYAAVDQLANDYLNDKGINGQIIDGYDCIYKSGSGDYSNISEYIQRNLNIFFDPSYYTVYESIDNYNDFEKQHNITVLNFYFNIKGYSQNIIGYKVYAIDDIVKIISFIGNDYDSSIIKLEAPSITDEKLIKLAVETDNNSFTVSDIYIKRFYDYNDSAFKCDVQITYIDDGGHYFATNNVFTLDNL